MEIQFLGATGVVTGSKYLLQTSDKRILIDCGLFQGVKELRLRNWDKFPVPPSTIDAVVLTHAHLDHTGYLPLLVKHGFRGKIFATPYTATLTRILLLDSAHLQEEEAARANKFGYSKHHPAKPLYTKEDALAVFPHLVIKDFHRLFNIGKTTLQFNYAGHIFGAASILIEHLGKSLFFSGDLGRPDTPGLANLDPPGNADYLIIESTYGGRLHEKLDPEVEFGKLIKKTIARSGTVLIPAFAVGRAQLLIYYLCNLKRSGTISERLPVYLDSPMAQAVTDLVLNSQDFFTDEVRKRMVQNVIYVDKLADSKALAENPEPKVIISASGMATGGRVLEHLRSFGQNSKNLILFSGYQVPGTRGAQLLNNANKVVKIFGELITISAEITELPNISAHMDYAEELSWLKKLNKIPRQVFVTHGEEVDAQFLKDKLVELWPTQITIPKYLETMEFEN